MTNLEETKTMEENTNIVLTNDETLVRDPHFQTIVEVVQSLINSGFVNSLAGNCIAAAEMVSLMLYQKGVEASVMECQVSIKKVNEDGSEQYSFVGFNGMGLGSNAVDTHAVAVVKGREPILIDLSIWTQLPGEHPFIVERVSPATDGLIGDYDYGDFRVTYTPKKDVRLPNLHQRSVLDRLRAEELIKAKLGWVAYVAMGALGVGLINTILNVVIVYFRVLGKM